MADQFTLLQAVAHRRGMEIQFEDTAGFVILDKDGKPTPREAPITYKTLEAVADALDQRPPKDQPPKRKAAKP